jgi:hypothetical protein
MRLAPGEAAHLSYTVTIAPSMDQAAITKGPMVSTADVWIEAAAAGAATRSSQTLTAAATSPGQLAKGQRGNAASGAPVLARYLQLGQVVYGYTGGNPTWIVIPGSHDQHPGWMIPNAALDGAGVAQELSVLAQRAPRQVRLLRAQTLDGVAVDVLQVSGWADAPGMRTTFYFDDHSFVLHGFDAVSIDPSYPTPSWQVRLASYTTMATAAVPPTAFTLNAPAGAQVDPPMVDLAGYVATFQRTCHSALAIADLEHILQARQQTLLAACQATAPTMSTAYLVGALIAPYRVTLSGAAAAIQLTPAQVSAALAAQQQWLANLLSIPGGGSSLS